MLAPASGMCVTSPFIKRSVCEAPLVRRLGRFSLDYWRLLTLYQWLPQPSPLDASELRVSEEDGDNKRGRGEVLGGEHQGLPVPPVQYENTQSVRISSWAQ